MFGWKIIIAFSGFVSALGIAFDRILLKRHKSQMHIMLVRWWVLLEDIRLPNLHSLMANYTVRVLKRIFLVKFGIWKAIIVSMTISFVLTTLAVLFGLHFEANSIDHGSWFVLPHFSVYVLNYFFDALTIIITFKLLKIISRIKIHTAILVAGVDIAIAFSLMTFCFAVMPWIEGISFNARLLGTEPVVSWEKQRARTLLEKKLANEGFSNMANISIQKQPNLPEEFGRCFDAIKSILKNGIYESSNQILVTVSEGHKEARFLITRSWTSGWFHLFVASTTFIPTMLYILILLILGVGKAILAAVQAAIMYFLEAATEGDPKTDPKEFMPGTLLGITLAVISAFVKLVFEIAKYWQKNWLT